MKKKNHIKMRFSTLLLCCLAILLCAVPCGAEIVPNDKVASGDILNVGIEPGMDVDRIENNWLHVLGTMNLYPGAYVDCIIYAHDGSTINIYGGELGTGYFIMLMGSASTAVVTVYGTGFMVDGVDIDPSASQFSVVGSGVLTGSYEDGAPINLLFLSDVPIHLHLKALDAEVEIDIKPGGNPNNINLRSKGVVPVAVLTTKDFDASTIDTDPDTDTVKFAGASPVRWRLCDVDDDGDDDLLFHFKTQELELNENSTEATLTIETNNGVISGTDTVRIVQSKKK